MSELRIVPVSFADACGFVAMWHRHHQPPVGHKFSIGVVDEADTLVGVAIVGRPVARSYDDGLTLEVNRTATDGIRGGGVVKIGSLFSGYGGLEEGVRAVLGGTVAWHSEIDPGACKILAHRYPDVPNLGDITAVDWASVEPVDVLTGGFPCQDVSAAGKRAGIRPGTRSGLWTQFAYAIDRLRPPLVVIENVRGLLSAEAHHPAHGDVEPCPWCLGDDESVALRALGAVLGDLAELGFNAEWVGLRAADVGAPHGRFRVFVVAWPADAASDQGRLGDGDGRPAADAGRLRGDTGRLAAPGQAQGGRALPLPGERRRVDAPAHAAGDGRHEGRTEPARLIGGPDAALGGGASTQGMAVASRS